MSREVSVLLRLKRLNIHQQEQIKAFQLNYNYHTFKIIAPLLALFSVVLGCWSLPGLELDHLFSFPCYTKALPRLYVPVWFFLSTS